MRRLSDGSFTLSYAWPVSFYNLTILILIFLCTTLPVFAIRKLQIVSPLQALTIWDPEIKEEIARSGEGTNPRSRFLPRFRAGLQAEASMQKRINENDKLAQQNLIVGASKEEWAVEARSIDIQRIDASKKTVELAYDQAVAKFDEVNKHAKGSRMKNSNRYQFVGVVNGESSGSPITWYVREKPANAKWSLRLVHVNREALLKDLYMQGKIDVFGRYENTGQRDEKSGQPIIVGKYSVREQSLK